MHGRLLAALAATAISCAVVAWPAGAYVAPGATLVSASLTLREQGDDASGQADLSSDGRYVVFSTTARNLFPPDIADPAGAFSEGGIFRRDLVTGNLELVAVGSLRGDDGTLRVRGAGNPSISADGRWVVFSTGDALVPGDTNEQIDVYVRDMSVAHTDPNAYELVSARDGSGAQARYEPRTPSSPFRDPGADVAPGSAISDDGQMVVFEVAAVATDLPDRGAIDTPAGQVFVRDRGHRTTSLVTRIAGSSPPQPVSAAGGPVGIGPAVISADGSTVSWAGQEAQKQTRFLAGEGQDGSVYFYLWQRIADGPSAPTRRITGAVDLDDPACAGDYVPSPSAVGACWGPLADTEQGLSGIAGTPPALSGDGRRVAFLTQSAPRGEAAVAAVDVFVTDMSPGVSRKAGTIELTREGTSRDPVASGSIVSVALSPDGRWAAIVTARTRFLLGTLRLVGDVRQVPGPPELYLLDLQGRTIERAARARDGGDADDAVSAQVALSADARRIAFASGADNLFFGDANQRSDVFTIDRADGPPPAPPEDEPPADPPSEPFATPPAPARRLKVYVRRAPRGKVRLDVRAPVKGKLAIAVRGRLPDADGRERGPARSLATAGKRVTRTGAVTVDIAIARKYRSALRRQGTLNARAEVTLTPATGTPLARTISVRFAAPAKAKTKR